MAFRKKADFILSYQPDILIVPECEQPDKLKFSAGTPIPTNTLWFGHNPHKGLAIFSYAKFTLQLLDTHNPELKMIIPIAVSGGDIDFTLFAIWAYNPLDKHYNYIGQVWKAMLHYENLLTTKNVILAGDFNSNIIWDKLNRKVSHAMVVEKLKSFNIFSTYHHHLNITPGVEAHPTFYLYRHQNKPYHLDYCFASSALLKKLQSVEVGEYNFCIRYSDHVPLIATFNS